MTKNNSTKLGFLGILKQEHKIEKYLILDYLENRRAITKLRTSSHNLFIETGRWENIDRISRICKQCSKQEIKDERRTPLIYLWPACDISTNNFQEPKRTHWNRPYKQSG